ncbi:MAG: hypothetical protein G01um101425_511 [Candidatus Peregrinibacteria bacterium Gr01-1014_25]|nr:MAG: hypothetical protein G01um101425_511 [Candidatus Peregrinibacteria bacterium Gr01-1014_25]
MVPSPDIVSPERISSAIAGGPEGLRALIGGTPESRFDRSAKARRASDVVRHASAMRLTEQQWLLVVQETQTSLTTLQSEIDTHAASLRGEKEPQQSKEEIDAGLLRLRQETDAVIAARKDISQIVLDRAKQQRDAAHAQPMAREPWSWREYAGAAGLTLTGFWLIKGLRNLVTRPAKAVTNVVRHPLHTIGKGFIAMLSVFFGAKLVERWLQKPSRDRMHKAPEGTEAFGSVAAGQTAAGHSSERNPSFAHTNIDTAKLPAVAADDPATLARSVIGTDADAPTDPTQRLAALNKRLREGVNRPGTFTLVDAYRLQALEELQAAERMESVGTPEALKAAKAARLRAAYCDSLAAALAEYASMWLRYEKVKVECKTDGLSPNPSVDSVARGEFLAVAAAARNRLTAGFGKGSKSPEAMEAAERTLWETLRVQGDDPTKALGVVRATTGLLQARYDRMVAIVNKEVPPELRNNHTVLSFMNTVVADHLEKNNQSPVAKKLRNSRVFLAPDPSGASRWQDLAGRQKWDFLKFPDIRNPKLGKTDWWFPKSTSATTIGLKEEALRELFREAFSADAKTVQGTETYGITPENAYEQYRELAKPFLMEGTQSQKELIERFEERGASHVDTLVTLQEQMARFQASRIALATIRHRGAKGPDATGTGRAVWADNDESLAREYDVFLRAQNRDGAARMQQHLTFVDQQLLQTGTREKLEHAWNHNGRNFIAYLADTVVSIETALVPKTFGLQGAAREALIGEFYELIGWPKYTDGPKKGQFKERADLTPAEREAFNKKQKSVLDCIAAFEKDGTEGQEKSINGKSHLANMRTSTTLAQQMSAPTAVTTIQGWMSEKEPQDSDIEKLSGVRVDRMEDIPAIAERHGVPKSAVVARCMVQLMEDIKAYHGAYRRFLKGVHEVLGMHMRWEAAIDAFFRQQLNIGLGIVTLVAGALIARKITRFVRGSGGVPRPPSAPPAKTAPPTTSKTPASKAAPEPKAPAAKPATPEKAAANTARAEKIAKQINWEKAIKGMKAEGMTAARMEEFIAESIKAGRLNSGTLAAIRQSPGAQKILIGAAHSGNPAEVTRALTMARNARNLRIGINTLGAAVDVFVIYMAYCDYLENGRKIEEAKKTGNVALQELYKDAQNANIVEGGVAATGLIVSGVAIVQAYIAGEGILMALGTSAGTIVLPLALATGAGMYLRGKAQEVTENWVKKVDDWKTKDSASLMGELFKSHDPSFWKSWAENTNAEYLWDSATKSQETFDREAEKKASNILGADENQRDELLKAYLANTSSLPQQDGESDQVYGERVRQYLEDQRWFLYKRNQHNAPTPLMFRYSRLHADLLAYARRLKASGSSDPIDDIPGDIMTDIAEYERLPPHKQMTVLQWYEGVTMERGALETESWRKLLVNTPADKRTHAEYAARSSVQSLLLSHVKDDLHILNGLIEALDRSDDQKASIRATMFTRFQEVLTGQEQLLLGTATQRAVSMPSRAALLTGKYGSQSVDAKRYEHAVASIRGLLQTYNNAVKLGGKELQPYTYAARLPLQNSIKALMPEYIAGHSKLSETRLHAKAAEFCVEKGNEYLRSRGDIVEEEIPRFVKQEKVTSRGYVATSYVRSGGWRGFRFDTSNWSTTSDRYVRFDEGRGRWVVRPKGNDDRDWLDIREGDNGGSGDDDQKLREIVTHMGSINSFLENPLSPGPQENDITRALRQEFLQRNKQ